LFPVLQPPLLRPAGPLRASVLDGVAPATLSFAV